MIVELIPKLGGQPLRLEAAQLLVRNAAGTPVAVAGEYGVADAIRVAHAGEMDFNQVLRAFGYERHQVIAQPLPSSPPPRGARLLSGGH